MKAFVEIVDRLIGSRWIVFATALIVSGMVTGGHPRASADTYFYKGLSDLLLNGDFHLIFSTAALKWTILSFVSLVTLSRSISPEHWMMIMMGVNILSSAGLAVLLVATVRRVTQSVYAAVAALLLYLGCMEILLWVPFILTDLIYSIIAFAIFALVLDGILGRSLRHRRLLLGATLVLVLFTRAVGIMLIPLVLFAELILAKPRQKRHRWLTARTIVIVGAFAVLATAYIRAYIVQDPAHWPFDFIRSPVTQLIAREKAGEVIWDRPETFRPPPVTVTDHVLLQLDRSVRFFQFTSSRYSRAHNLLNTAYFVPLYILALVGFIDGLLTAHWQRKASLLAAMLWIIVYAFYHGLTILDFDWRYRVPLLPHLIFLGACGVDALVRRFLPRAPLLPVEYNPGHAS